MHKSLPIVLLFIHKGLEIIKPFYSNAATFTDSFFYAHNSAPQQCRPIFTQPYELTDKDTKTHTHKSIPQYSNLTLHLPLSDKTCIINSAKCCQETSDSYQPPLAHTQTHQQSIHHNITRFSRAGASTGSGGKEEPEGW